MLLGCAARKQIHRFYFFGLMSSALFTAFGLGVEILRMGFSSNRMTSAPA
jgi:hypothetical protein